MKQREYTFINTSYRDIYKMILRESLISAQSTVALVKFFVTCVRIRHIIYEILCYSVIYGRGLYKGCTIYVIYHMYDVCDWDYKICIRNNAYK